MSRNDVDRVAVEEEGNEAEKGESQACTQSSLFRVIRSCHEQCVSSGHHFRKSEVVPGCAALHWLSSRKTKCIV